MATVNSNPTTLAAITTCRLCNSQTDQRELFTDFFNCSACGSLYGTPRETGERFGNYWLSGIPSSGLKRLSGLAWYWLVRHTRSKQRQLAYVQWLKAKCNLESVNSVLDIGCGQGFLLSEFQSIGKSVHGIEPDSNVPKVRSVRSKIETGYFGKNSLSSKFDLIVAGQVICYWEDANESIKQLLDSVSEGGYLFLSTVNTEGISQVDYPGLSVNPTYISPKALKTLLRQDGFNLVAEETFSQSDLTVSRSSKGKLGKAVDYLKLIAGWALGNPFYVKGRGETIFCLAQKRHPLTLVSRHQ